jgi:hypothetical protein
MLPEQAAGPAKPGITGKAQTAAPGAKPAKGGSRTPVNIGGMARPARPGSTGQG